MMAAIDIARVCHEANRTYCKVTGEDPPIPWHLMTNEAQDKLIEAVNMVYDGATPQEMHDNWCRVREAEGWQLGFTLNRELKIHPNLVPWHELPTMQQRKDLMFSAIVKALAWDGEDA